jgi:hypothetical protein
MNAVDVLKYGNLTMLSTVESVPQERWEISGACGWWSVKNIVAHLASYERALEDLLVAFVDGDPLTFPSPFTADFNDSQVDQRRHLSPSETLAEYNKSHARVMELVREIPDETLRQPGLLPWYGDEYALDDLIVYQYYGHKREHCGQIAVWRDAADK